MAARCSSSSRPSRRAMVTTVGRAMLAGAGVALLAACGRVDAVATVASTTSSVRASASSSARPINTTITAGTVAPAVSSATLIYTSWGDKLRLDAQQKTTDRFTSQHPGIKVEFATITGSYDEKLQGMFAAGLPPDSFRCEDSVSWNFFASGAARSLDDLMARDRVDPATFMLPPYTVSRYENKWYGFPHGGWGNYLLYINLDLFTSAGITPPAPDVHWTWDDFLHTCQQLTITKNSTTESYGTSLDAMTGWILGWLYLNGADDLSDDGTQVLLDRREAIDALQWVADLANKYKVAVRRQDLPKGINDPFLAGKVATYYTGIWYNVQAVSAKFDFAVVLPPVHTTATTWAKPNNHSTAKESKQQEAAWTFLRYMTSEENQQYEADLGIWAPGNKALLEAPSYLHQQVPPHDFRPGVPNLLMTTRGPNYSVGYADVQSALRKALEPLWNGQQSAQDAANAAAQAMRAALAAAKKS